MIKQKQVFWVAGASVRASNVAASGASTNVTSAITTALSTAGKAGVSVPVQVSADEDSVGVVTASTLNLVAIQNNTSKDKIKDSAGNEVYGRLTQSAGVYTLTYYTLVNGTETAFNLPAQSIDIDFSYRFDFARLPSDFAIALGGRVVNNDPRGSGASTFTELLTVTGTNAISALTKTPSATANILLIVNDAVYTTLGGGSARFSVSGKVITWSAANAGFNVDTTDFVVAQYTTLE